MKTCLFVLLIIIYASFVSGQNRFKVEFKKADVAFSAKEDTLAVKSLMYRQLSGEIEHLRYCMGKYHKQKMTGYYFGFSAIGIGACGVAVDEPSVLIGSGVLGLVGLIISVDSEKWLKKASLTPYGLGLKYTF